MGGLGDKEKGRNRRVGKGQEGIRWDRKGYGRDGIVWYGKMKYSIGWDGMIWHGIVRYSIV